MTSGVPIITYFKLRENQNLQTLHNEDYWIITYFKLRENQNCDQIYKGE